MSSTDVVVEPAAAPAEVLTGDSLKQDSTDAAMEPIEKEETETSSTDVAIEEPAAAPAEKPVKKAVVKRKSAITGDRLKKGSLRRALMAGLKAESGRSDLSFDAANASHADLQTAVPCTERAGYPVVRAEGSVDPAAWETVKGKKIAVDFNRHSWLPDTWGQGVKSTEHHATLQKGTGRFGGTYTVIIAPDGKVFYHQKAAEAYAGFKFSAQNSLAGAFRAAWKQAEQVRQSNESDESFFELLSEAERKVLPAAAEFHFCIVSARRATNAEGVKDIATVQSALVNAGAAPTWYVDEGSLKDYQGLGLTAVVGGKLTPARNMALDDAEKVGKVCVQLSDDIASWEYRHGEKSLTRDDAAMNAAWTAAKRFVVSPVTAARFILAKMRASHDSPKLGGVYMLKNCSRTFAADGVDTFGFCIGDFFVAEVSNVRFDETMTLKEDYDFTCSHIHADGSVLRLNRMTLNVKHYANVGGAVDNRDDSGSKERRNIDILNQKWPGCFRKHPKRANEVILNWRTVDGQVRDNGDGEADVDCMDGLEGKVAPTTRPAPAGRRKRVQARKEGAPTEGKEGAPTEGAVSPGTPVSKGNPVEPESSEKPAMPAKQKGVKKVDAASKVRKEKSVGSVSFAMDAVVMRTGKIARSEKVTQRLEEVHGFSVEAALKTAAYTMADLKYDVKSGFLSIS